MTSEIPTDEITAAIAGRGMSPAQAAQRERDIAAVATAMDPPPPPPATDESLLFADEIREGIRQRGPTPARRRELADAAGESAAKSRLDQLLAGVELSPDEISDGCDAIRRALHPDD